MDTIEFFEKPGCSTNTKQVAALRAAGCAVDTRSLLSHPWTADTLLAFLGPLPSTAWFNPAAPRVKTGQIRPDALTPDEALAALLDDHLLIRRPLIRIGDTRMVGFDPQAISAALGAPLPGLVEKAPPEGCSHAPGEPRCGSGAHS